MNQEVKLVLLISFLDSLCTGLVVPTLAPHIIRNGGNHFILGLLASFTFFSHIISAPFHKAYIGSHNLSRRTEVVLSLLISFLSYFLISIQSSYWMVLLSRFIFGASNRTKILCKKQIEKKTEENVVNLMNMFDITGIVVGPILGGHLFEMCFSTVFCNGYLACLITIIPIVIANNQINWDCESSNEEVNDEPQTITIIQLKKLIEIGLKLRYLHITCLKLMYLFCSLIFFIKFAFILRENFGFTAVEVGYTVAYQNIIVFGANFLVPFINRWLFLKRTHPQLELVQFTFYLIGFTCSLLILCFIRNFDIYLIVFIIMAQMHALVETSWENICTKLYPENYENLLALDNFIGIFAPVFFGIICSFYGMQSFYLFLLLPVIVLIFSLREFCFSNYKSKKE